MSPVPRILVVDDNETLRTLVVQALESEGYVTIAAESGEVALEVAQYEPPDLFIVDHVMPGMTGAELIRQLRSAEDPRLRRIPCIGLSAYDVGRHEMVAAGAVEAIAKPVSYALLLDRVGHALGVQLVLERQAPA